MENLPLSDPDLADLSSPRRKWDGSLLMLLVVAAGTVLIWRLPFGQQALWPFTILATWYHEMGHALTALVLGGDVLGLRIYADGSGLAMYRGVGLGRLGEALVAAGGPLAPSIAGGVMIAASRNKTGTRVCLFALSLLLVLSALVWIGWWESPVGAIAIFAIGAGIFAVALAGGGFLRTFALQLCGVQACISLWRHWSYFFASQATIGGEVQHSDAAAIAEALWLPHWFWGFLLTALSAAILLGSLWLAFQPRCASVLETDLPQEDIV